MCSKLLLFLVLLTMTSLKAASTTTLKLAFLAPEGVTWSVGMQKIADAVKTKTQGRVEFKLYFNGVVGDEADVLRKIRIGQMGGGMFTGKTLGDIYPDIRVMEIPFTFHEKLQKALPALTTLTPDFKKEIEKKGHQCLAIYEVGHVYLATTKKVKSLDELKGLKIWTWEGDKIAETLIKNMKLISVPLALPDVLSSLSSGIIDAAYAPPLALMALQWHTKVKYVINHPIAYATGALLVSKKEWNKIAPADQKIITETADTEIKMTNEQTEKDNEAAVASLKKIGIEFISFPEKDYANALLIRDAVKKELEGSFLSKVMIDKLNNIIK